MSLSKRDRVVEQNLEEWGIGQNFKPSPRSDLRVLGGVRVVVRSWKARLDGRTK